MFHMEVQIKLLRDDSLADTAPGFPLSYVSLLIPWDASQGFERSTPRDVLSGNLFRFDSVPQTGPYIPPRKSYSVFWSRRMRVAVLNVAPFSDPITRKVDVVRVA